MQKVAVALAFVLQGCVVLSYRHPEPAGLAPPVTADVLQYQLLQPSGLSFGGKDGLAHACERAQRPTQRVFETATQGLFVQVAAAEFDPSTAALIYGYVDLSLAAILPYYSDSSGFELRFEVTRDGQKLKTYRYEVHRQLFAWLPAIAVVWLNLLTTDAEDAFAASAEQFFADLAADGL
jgi:hypothetical protein